VRLAFLVALGALLLGACGGSSDRDTEPTATAGVAGVCLSGETRAPALAACEALAQQLDVSRDEIELLSMTPMDWPNSCLGAPMPDEMCAEVITPGFEVVLGAASDLREYVYHTDESETVRLAEVRSGGDSEADLGDSEVVVRAREPVAFAFAPDGRLFYNERTLGEIRTADADGVDGDSELFATVPTFPGSECGLLGIAVDPEFETNGYVYVYVTQPIEGRTDVGQPRLVRYRDENGRGVDPAVLLDDLPLTNEVNCAHVAGNVHFGPDGYLYVSVGNFERPETSGDLSALSGKILRLNKSDGSPAPDSPLDDEPGADARIFAYGLRNPFDFAFNPVTGMLYAGENGPGNCDELNVIFPGGDYGVPDSLPIAEATSCLGLGGRDPIYLFSKAGLQPEEFGSNVAPAGIAFLPAGAYPQLGEGILACEFVTGLLRFIELTGPERAGQSLVLNQDCRLNVELGPDGLIYYSNGEGVYRLPPD
jgi:glucose/arabinose dehydrogenase